MINILFKKVKFHQRDYTTIIEKELRKNNELTSTFLLHGYIEAYSREILLLEIKTDDKKIMERIGECINVAKFPSLVLTLLYSEQITYEEYLQLDEFNTIRNKLAHRLIDFEDNTDNKEEILKTVNVCLGICKKLATLHNKIIEDKVPKAEQKFYDEIRKQSDKTESFDKAIKDNLEP